MLLLCLSIFGCSPIDNESDTSIPDRSTHAVGTESFPPSTSSIEGGNGGEKITRRGAGRPGYTCPEGATYIGPSDSPRDVQTLINDQPAGATICIEGPHRASSTVRVKNDQTLIGIGPDARISGASVLSGWTPIDGVYRYDGALATQGPNRRGYVFDDANEPIYRFSKLADDVFIDDQRMMRVLSTDQLTGELPRGQAVTDGETGRFFFDYKNDAIYITEDPTGRVVELSTTEDIITGFQIDNVTLQNLFIEKSINVAVAASSGESWLIEDCTIRFAHTFGIRGGRGVPDARFEIRGSVITNNGQYGIGGNDGSWITIEDSELSWNNIANYRKSGGYHNSGATKFARSEGTESDGIIDYGLIVRGIESHHNIGDGFWTDIGNRYVLVEDSEFHHNERHGYFHEIGCEIEIRNNVVHNNASVLKNPDLVGYQTAGITVMSSIDGLVTGNTVYAQRNAILVIHIPSHSGIAAQTCLPHTSDTDNRKASRRNVVRANQIYLCTPAEKVGGLNLKNRVLESRGNSFDDNVYFVSDDSAEHWHDGTPMTWSVWQSMGYDTGGSRTVGSCSP